LDIGPLSITTLGNKNDLTTFSKAIPLPNQEATMGAKEFVTKIICEHDIPETVLADQGTNFLSEVFKNVCKLQIESLKFRQPCTTWKGTGRWKGRIEL